MGAIVIVDLENKENQVTTREIDLEFSTKAKLRKCKDLTDLQILKFRNECKNFVTQMTTAANLL